jgi:hypothetical protein
VPGHSASFGVTPEGVTTVSYFATDAAGNEETARTLDVKIDGAPPVLSGLPPGSFAEMESRTCTCYTSLQIKLVRPASQYHRRPVLSMSSPCGSGSSLDNWILATTSPSRESTR